MLGALHRAAWERSNRPFVLISRRPPPHALSTAPPRALSPRSAALGMSNVGHPEARAALAAALPALAAGLPPAPAVSDTTFLTHSSAHGATHWKFEAPAGHAVLDYERLEVRWLPPLPPLLPAF